MKLAKIILFNMDDKEKALLWLAIIGFMALVFFYSVSNISANWCDIYGTYLCNTDSFIKVEGTIESTEVVKVLAMDWHRPIKPYYSPCITYSYIVNSAEYKSDKIAFARIKLFEKYEDAKSYLTIFPNKGKKVEVYYDSSDPNISILDPIEKEYFVGIILGALLLHVFLIVSILNKYFNSRHKQVGSILEDKLDKLVTENKGD